jgi:uncharacterized membrane protein
MDDQLPLPIENPPKSGAPRTDALAGDGHFVVWPHRSLSPRGIGAVLGIAALGLTIVVLRIPAPAVWFLMPPAMIAFVGLSIAFWISARRGQRTEIIHINPDEVRVAVRYRGRHKLVARFNPHWVRLRVEDDRYVTRRIIMSESGQAVSIGECLTASERETLADALRAQLERARGGMHI